MRLSAINGLNFNGTAQTAEQKPARKHFTDKFQDNIRNSADINDCVSVPRSIFKGYLGFFVGTTMLTMGGLLKNPAVKKGLSLAGSLTTIAGTWFFVRPYIVKGAAPTVDPTKKA